MIPPRRPRRSSPRQKENDDAVASQPAETARLRRERRNRTSPRTAGSQPDQTPAPAKPRTRSKPASRSRVSRINSMANPPPVYMRGGMANLPVQPRKLGAPPKRRYNVALNVPGAELHLPALPIFRFSWRLASGLLAALMLALAVQLWTSSKYRIDMVEVTGLKRLTSNDVNTVVGLSGQSIFSANPAQIRQDLKQAFPDIMNVSVKVSMPARVVVSAEERQPVILWKQNGREQWIDMEGNAFPPRGNAGKLVAIEAQNDPPTIEKTSVTDLRFLSPEMVGAIIRMSMKAPKDSALLYSREHGLGWMDSFNSQVYFGPNLVDMDQKLLVYQALAAKLQKDGLQPILISVEYVHAPYYRLEP
jgi:cell division protein FtsQ